MLVDNGAVTSPPRSRSWQKAVSRIEWNRWVVSLLSLAAILWAVIRPEMALSCLVIAVGALAIAVMGRDAR